MYYYTPILFIFLLFSLFSSYYPHFPTYISSSTFYYLDFYYQHHKSVVYIPSFMFKHLFPFIIHFPNSYLAANKNISNINIPLCIVSQPLYLKELLKTHVKESNSCLVAIHFSHINLACTSYFHNMLPYPSFQDVQ